MIDCCKFERLFFRLRTMFVPNFRDGTEILPYWSLTVDRFGSSRNTEGNLIAVDVVEDVVVDVKRLLPLYTAFGQTGTVLKGLISDAGYRTWDVEALEAGTAREGIHADRGQTYREGDAGQTCTIAEGRTVDGRNSLWYFDASQARTTLKGRTADTGQAIWEIDFCQFDAILESTTSNVDDALWQLDAGQTCAVAEGPLGDAGYTIGNDGVLASSDQFVVYFLDDGVAVIAAVIGFVGCIYLHADDRRTIGECMISDAGDIGRDDDANQAGATEEG